MKNYKRVLALILISIFALTGCSNGNKEVTSAVDSFMTDIKEFNLLNINEHLINKESDFTEEGLKALENDEAVHSLLEYFKSNAAKLTYEIDNIELDKDKASVEMKVKYINGENVIEEIFEEFFKETFSRSFIDGDMSDEKMEEIMKAIVEDKRKNSEEIFEEKKLKLELTNRENKWYVNEIDEELLDILTSNFNSLVDDLDGLGEFEGGADEVFSDNENIIEKNLGDEIELDKIKFTITTVEETDEITSDYDVVTKAKEGAKFIVVGIDVTNISKSSFDLSPEFLLIDNEGREYNSYSSGLVTLGNSMDHRELAAGIKESGFYAFEVAEDSIGYSIFMGKESTDEIYEVILR